MLIENRRHQQPFYLMAPRVAVALGHDRDGRDRHRIAGGEFPVCLGPPGVSFGLAAALPSSIRPRTCRQIYVPTMNWILMVAALALVMGFGSSAALAGAYGLAVSGAMTIVTPLTLSLIKSRTGSGSRALRMGLSCCFIVDVAFLLAI